MICSVERPYAVVGAKPVHRQSNARTNRRWSSVFGSLKSMISVCNIAFCDRGSSTSFCNSTICKCCSLSILAAPFSYPFFCLKRLRQLLTFSIPSPRSFATDSISPSISVSGEFPLTPSARLTRHHPAVFSESLGSFSSRRRARSRSLAVSDFECPSCNAPDNDKVAPSIRSSNTSFAYFRCFQKSCASRQRLHTSFTRKSERLR
jgi:hypothetical protein